MIDLSSVKRLIAIYPSPDNCVPVAEKTEMKLDGCFIGACTTTQEDLILAALVLQQAMLEGKRPCESGQRRVTPGSLEIIQHLKKLGMIEIFQQAGFKLLCRAKNEVWLSSQNRNFRNRMGRGSIGILASAACVAASSFDMKPTEPTAYLAKIDQDLFKAYRGWHKDDFN